jgi:hypothetical protein
MIKNIVGDAQLLSHGPRITDILTGTAAAGATDSFAMIIELQGNANRLCTGSRSQCRDDAGVDAAGHRNDDALAGQIVPELKFTIDSVSHNVTSLNDEPREAPVLLKYEPKTPGLTLLWFILGRKDELEGRFA